MSGVARITISVDEDLLEKFDQLIEQNRFPNRSEAFRSLIRDSIVRREWNQEETSSDLAPEPSGDLAGTITIVYDHHHTSLLRQVMEIQHDFGSQILCSQHAHLDHHNCMECIIVHGTRDQICELYRQLTACKGMKHTSLSMTTTGKELS